MFLVGSKGVKIPNVMKVELVVAEESGNKLTNKQTNRQDSFLISIDMLFA